MVTTVVALVALAVQLPAIHLRWAYERSAGRITAVLPARLPDGRVRVSIAYEFTIPDPGEVHGLIGHAVSGSTLMPSAGPDPILPAKEARAWEQTLERRMGRRLYPVYYQANDPEGTAFILFSGVLPWLQRIGLGTLAIVLLWGILPVRRPDPGRMAWRNDL